MNDPRENCPWKCKHCLCYEGEIKRQSADNQQLRAALKLNKLSVEKAKNLRAVYEAIRPFVEKGGVGYMEDEEFYRLKKACERVLGRREQK